MLYTEDFYYVPLCRVFANRVTFVFFFFTPFYKSNFGHPSRGLISLNPACLYGTLQPMLG